MTEKRFIKLLEKEFMLYDNWENKQITDYDTVTNLLNNLNKENEELKERIKVLEDAINGLTETVAHFDLDGMMK